MTNDIFTREDAEFLTRNAALPADRIAAVETGGCPHAAIREDVSANLEALEALTRAHPDAELLLCESGGDNLAAHFSNELADFSVYVIDVAGGDKVPRKGGPGITQADVLVVNKVDLAPAVGADQRSSVALATSINFDDAAPSERTNARPDETGGTGAQLNIGRGGFDGGHGPGTYRIVVVGRVRMRRRWRSGRCWRGACPTW